MNLTSGILKVTMALALCGSAAWAQAPPAAPKPAADATTTKPILEVISPKPTLHCSDVAGFPVKTFYLTNAVQQSDANEIITALRNMLSPCDKAYLVANQGAIVMQASPDDYALVQKLLSDLDRPKRTYRLTYTVTEMDGGKRLGVQHFAMVVASGQKTTLKQGSRVPIATGSYRPDGSPNATQQTQFTYLDVGMSFDAGLDEFANGVRLISSVEQSSVSEDKSIAGVQEPVIRQTSLKGAAFLTPGKPLMLGTIDIPGSTRQLDVEVMMEQIP
jgi:type II secretory pathway component GspD/PulD (secretin)